MYVELKEKNMCIKASKAWEVTQGSLDFTVKREIFELATINSLIQNKCVQGETSLIYTLYQGTLNDGEYSKFRKAIIDRLKDEAGYILRRVKHPDTNKFIIDISWDRSGDLPEGV